jgi:hypothetical protein
MVFLALGDKPEQIVRRQVREHLYGKQLSYEFSCWGWRGVFGHERGALHIFSVIALSPDTDA